MYNLTTYIFNILNKNYPWFLDFVNWKELEQLAAKLQKEKKLTLYEADWKIDFRLVGRKIVHKAKAVY